jgi:hypothetical protein
VPYTGSIVKRIMCHTVISFVWVSAIFGTCTVMSVNGILVESKMCTFTIESTHFIFNKCPIYTHDGTSAKFSTNSNETDYSAVTVKPIRSATLNGGHYTQWHKWTISNFWYTQKIKDGYSVSKRQQIFVQVRRKYNVKLWSRVDIKLLLKLTTTDIVLQVTTLIFMS